MKRPSHLEMAGWGLASMLGAWVLAYWTPLGIGLPAFAVGLSLAAARAAGGVLVGLRTFVALVLVTVLIVAFTPGLFCIDPMRRTPVTVGLLPAVYGQRTPSLGWVHSTLFLASVVSALVFAMTVRVALRRESMTPAVIQAVTVFAITLAVHLVLVADSKGGSSPIEVVLSVYSLMPVYAGYFVALFWDVAGEKAADSVTR